MEYFILVCIFILGTLIGSFLNVVVLRYNTGMTLGGRSGCFSCGKQLHWYELVPVASFVAQKAKCRGCKAKISWQYPLVEVLSGLVFLLVFIKQISSASLGATGLGAGGLREGLDAFLASGLGMHTFLSIIFYWVIFSILIVILVYDLRHKIIPNTPVYVFIVLSFLSILLAPLTWSSVLAGPILFLPFFLLWYVSDGKWIGLGDGKIALGAGWLLGLGLGASAIIYAFWIGAAASIILLAFQSRRYGLKSEIPFAPFIVLSIFLAYYFRVDAVNLLLLI